MTKSSHAAQILRCRNSDTRPPELFSLEPAMSMFTADAPWPQEIWDNQVASINEPSADWLLPGFISRGNVTLLTSMWKAGKTTLLAHLLARRAKGLPLLGFPVTPGKTVVVSEEPRSLWNDRCRQFD